MQSSKGYILVPQPQGLRQDSLDSKGYIYVPHIPRVIFSFQALKRLHRGSTDLKGYSLVHTIQAISRFLTPKRVLLGSTHFKRYI